MKRFGGAVLLAIYGLVFHGGLIWAMTIALMFALATMNTAAGAPTSGNQFIGYWILTFVTVGAAAIPLCLWDMDCWQLGQRAFWVMIRRWAAVAGALGAFYVFDASEPFVRGVGSDLFLFAYASPAIAVLIGLLYADVSHLMLSRIRLVAVVSPTRVKFRRDDSDTASQP